MAPSADQPKCKSTNRRGEPCGAIAQTPDGLCAIHGGVVDPKVIGAKGGSTRKGKGDSAAIEHEVRLELRRRTYDNTALIWDAFEAGLRAQDPEVRIRAAATLMATAFGQVKATAVVAGMPRAAARRLRLVEEARAVHEAHA